MALAHAFSALSLLEESEEELAWEEELDFFFFLSLPFSCFLSLSLSFFSFLLSLVFFWSFWHLCHSHGSSYPWQRQAEELEKQKLLATHTYTKPIHAWSCRVGSIDVVVVVHASGAEAARENDVDDILLH